MRRIVPYQDCTSGVTDAVFTTLWWMTHIAVIKSLTWKDWIDISIQFSWDLQESSFLSLADKKLDSWWCPVFPREPDKQWDQNKFSIWKKTKLDGHSSFLNKPNVMLLLSGLLGHSWRFYWFHCVFCSWFLLVWLLNVGANCWYLNDHPLFDSDELPLLFTLLQHQVCHLLSCQLFTETNAPRKAKHVTCIFKSCTRETFIF